MLSILYYTIIFIVTVVYFVIFATVFALTYPFDRKRIILHYASIVWARGVFIANPLWKVVVEGSEGVEKGKPYVVVVNHQSIADVPLMYVLPFDFKWVCKKEVAKIPLFGWVMYMHGDIPIDRKSSTSLKSVLQKGSKYLKLGVSVNMFPEGTRAKNGVMKRFKDGAFILAKQAEVDILPCVIDGDWNLLNGWKLRMPHTFKVSVMKPISKEYVASCTAKELAEQVQKMMSEELERLRS